VPSSARRTAEELLLEATGARSIGRLCRWCGSSSHGRPVALGTDAHVSISYADGLLAVAWSYDGPVGIDVERDLAEDRAGWTRVEALLKATGEGLRDWPDVVLPDLPTSPLDLPPGYVGTIAGTGVSWRVHRESP
jgi:hypothetical protein